MALTIDRICLIIYLVLNLSATALFIYNSPVLFDSRMPISKMPPQKPLSSDAINMFRHNTF